LEREHLTWALTEKGKKRARWSGEALDKRVKMNYQILKAEINDAEEILEVQKLAYEIEAKRYNNYNIPPLKQTLEELKNQFKDYIILKAVADGRIIGTVRAREKKGTCFIGMLAVQPDLQNRGIGTSLMKEIETYFAPKRYELFVGLNSDNNIHLYKKLGYNIYKRDAYEYGDTDIYYMEKKLTTI
jgi:ribosomal protein S18 acetylase RimI-like enzyme